MCLTVFRQHCETVSSQAGTPTGWMLVEIVKFSFIRFISFIDSCQIDTRKQSYRLMHVVAVVCHSVVPDLQVQQRSITSHSVSRLKSLCWNVKAAEIKFCWEVNWEILDRKQWQLSVITVGSSYYGAHTDAFGIRPAEAVRMCHFHSEKRVLHKNKVDNGEVFGMARKRQKLVFQIQSQVILYKMFRESY